MPNRPPQIDCCAVILSGGLNTRMAGRNKAFLKIGGQTILERLLKSLQPEFKEILLATRRPDLYAGQPVRVVEDIYADRSSLTGIHAGLVYARAPFAFMVPCDSPFLQSDLIRLLLNELDPALDVVVPFLDGHYQPLCAIYSKRCIPVIEEQLNSSDYKIINLFNRMNVQIVPVEKLKTADPNMLSFLNVNTPAAYDTCRNMAAGLSNKKE